MLAVVVAWVFFRAETFSGATTVLTAMFAINASTIPSNIMPVGFDLSTTLFAFTGMLLIVTSLPNAVQLTRNHRPIISTAGDVAKLRGKFKKLLWSPTPRWATLTSALAIAAIIQIYRSNGLTEFIYFNF